MATQLNVIVDNCSIPVTENVVLSFQGVNSGNASDTILQITVSPDGTIKYATFTPGAAAASHTATTTADTIATATE